MLTVKALVRNIVILTRNVFRIHRNPAISGFSSIVLHQADFEVHLGLRARPVGSRVRDTSEVPDDRLVGQLELEGIDEGVQHDLCRRITLGGL